MEPLHFGSAEAPLFGMYHPPAAGFSTTGVVLCSPLGQEAIRLFRCYRDVALRLSMAGMHCFRFDYRGCGDSAGDESDYDLDGWQEDIGIAVGELRDISGVERIAYIGARLGGSLALRAANRAAKPATVILIDPVLSGIQYLDAQQRAHGKMCVDPHRFQLPRSVHEAPEDLLGFRLNTDFRQAIASLDLLQEDLYSGLTVHLLMSERTDALNAFASSLSGDAVVTPFSPNWNDPAYLEQTLIVPQLVAEICERTS